MRKLILYPLALALALVVAACGGDDYEQSLIDALAQDSGDLSEDASRCAAKVTIEAIGADRLQEDGYTPANIADRVDAGGPIQYLSLEAWFELMLDCADSPEDLTILVRPSASASVTADYECAIEEVGVDRTKELALDQPFTEPLDSVDEFRAAVNTCRGVDDDVAGSTAGDDEGAVAPPTTTTTRPPTTTTTIPTPERPAFAAETPPLLAIKNLAGTPGAPGEIGIDGGAGPFAYLENAADDQAVVTMTDSVSGSPDGTLVAIAQRATAIEDTSIRFVSVATGEEIDVLELDLPNQFGTDIRWSPDSRAIVFGSGPAQSTLYRIGTGTTATLDGWVNDLALAGNAGASTAVSCLRRDSLAVTIADDGTTSQIDLPTCARLTEFVHVDGDWTIGYNDLDNAVWRLGAGQEPEQVAPSAGRTTGSAACGAVRTFSYGGQPPEQLLIDLRSGTSAETLASWGWGCPLRSPDGTKLAHWLVAGGVAVVDLETGVVTEVANTGVPWAFSADGEQLLVSGGGTFVVATDGSGGVEATAQAVSANRAFCRAGESGTGLLATAAGVGLFDVGQNRFIPLGPDLRLPNSCVTSGDDRWLLVDGFLVDLADGTVLDLHQVDVPSGARLHDQVRPESGSERRLIEYMWVGGQQHLATVGSRR